MIDLMLQDAGVLTFGFDDSLFSVLIQVTYTHTIVARNLGSVSGDTETAFEEFDARVARNLQLRINENVEIHGDALAFA